MDNLKNTISEFFSNHNEIHLATVSADGKPWVATVAYASEGNNLFVLTDKNTIKCKNIIVNPNVSFTSAVDGSTWMDIKSLQMKGKAEILQNNAEFEKAAGLIIKKFPQMANLEPSPEPVVIKITLQEGFMLDYTKGFMHREKVVYL